MNCGKWKTETNNLSGHNYNINRIIYFVYLNIDKKQSRPRKTRIVTEQATPLERVSEAASKEFSLGNARYSLNV